MFKLNDQQDSYFRKSKMTPHRIVNNVSRMLQNIVAIQTSFYYKVVLSFFPETIVFWISSNSGSCTSEFDLLKQLKT